MRETSQRGPDIERERQHEEFKAFPTKLISLSVGLQPSSPPQEKLPALGIAKLKPPSRFGVGGLKRACSVRFFQPFS